MAFYIRYGSLPMVKERPVVELVDVPAFGRSTRLCWHNVRWQCLTSDCDMLSWTSDDPRIAGPRQALTDRAGRWVALQVGK